MSEKEFFESLGIEVEFDENLGPHSPIFLMRKEMFEKEEKSGNS